ncbi:MAG: DUF2254 domain-containing protein [Euryarchaeota archaeon]|nr:DUF2254 domain-containing protein [Euryarchaeota archaeon]
MVNLKVRWKRLAGHLRGTLWFRPAAISLATIAAVFLAMAADQDGVPGLVPDVSVATVETLLKIMGASMLVIATFAVGAMVSSYASASTTATPRSFSLVLSDDVSQNALSVFVGSFIFSIVGLIALLNGLYGKGGRFALLILTVLVFAIVISTFVRWVDRIARLGRLGTTIEKAEAAASKAFHERLRSPTLGGRPVRPDPDKSQPVYADSVGHVQQIDMARLQKYAKEADIRFVVAALPGTFIVPGRPLAFMVDGPAGAAPVDRKKVAACFEIADARTFEDDPRFGLVVLSEIAGRALSPAVNDPGTAISVINVFVRLFVLWNERIDEKELKPLEHDRVEVPELGVQDMFDDAFVSIARDGARMVEVGVRLQKALHALAKVGDKEMRSAADRHARLAMARAEKALELPEDIEAVRDSGLLAGSGTASKA